MDRASNPTGGPPGTDDDLHWQPGWTPEERESFFVAIARHERASWRVTTLAAACIAVLAFIVAVLMAPILYALTGLLLDLVNLAIPMPDLTGGTLRGLGDLTDQMETLPWTRWLGVLVIASIPGLALLALVVATLARALRAADDVGDDSPRLRRPLPTQLAEQRFANVVGEMAVAASIAEPRVLVSERAAPNAVVLGADASHVTIVVSRSLLDLLDRDEMQGIAAHLVATIANGDVRAGARVALSLGLFGLITRLTAAILDRDAARLLPSLVLAALRPDTARARALLGAIANPFGGDALAPARPAATRRGSGSDSLTWREWAAMPFTGPLVMSGFFGGLVSCFVLAPLVALAWRQRKYLADSTAVRLTRNPDTLAGALQKIGPLRGGASFAPWAAHLAVVQDGSTGRSDSLLSSSPLPMFPGLERRLKALVRQGATVTVVEKKVPPLAWLVGVPVGLLVAALMTTAIVLLLWVSLALSGLFTLLPFGALNVLLRWLGG
jgi:Zn-dependent protease with chaperone function